MYYMITWGNTQIEEAYVGRHPEEVIEKARSFINQWPEYQELKTEELLGYLLEDNLEFDLVQIKDPWQGDLSLNKAIEVYEKHSIPPHMYADQI